METKKILIILGVIVLIVVGYFYAYIKASASMYSTHTVDESPYFITTKPMVVKNLNVPKGTKIQYSKRYFWQKIEQKKMPKEEDITQISFEEGVTINWGGVPITSIYEFYNPEMTGYTVNADFKALPADKETPFSKQWQSCHSNLGISVKNANDWSCSKNNILDIESCSVIYQRYFSDDVNQQDFLNELYQELMKVAD
ncbi:hypothetical protein [uncultured Formosa sp.]|uniref:hypothetical protein n=1 Tax=uncultured Formosa sp. TaxID=255435 RepID=UPI002605BF23|nr:hypothetical protein [uncultured Formosa sp.]